MSKKTLTGTSKIHWQTTVAFRCRSFKIKAPLLFSWYTRQTSTKDALWRKSCSTRIRRSNETVFSQVKNVVPDVSQKQTAIESSEKLLPWRSRFKTIRTEPRKRFKVDLSALLVVMAIGQRRAWGHRTLSAGKVHSGADPGARWRLQQTLVPLPLLPYAKNKTKQNKNQQGRKEESYKSSRLSSYFSDAHAAGCDRTSE